MDYSSLIPYVVTSLSTLLVAYLGHSAAANALTGAVKQLMADLGGGHSVSALQKDVDDMKVVIADVKAVLAEKSAPAPTDAPNA